MLLPHHQPTSIMTATAASQDVKFILCATDAFCNIDSRVASSQLLNTQDVTVEFL